MASLIREDLDGQTIGTVQGGALYSHTEVEDLNEDWNDDWPTRLGFYVIHEGQQHHVYATQDAPERTACGRCQGITQVRLTTRTSDEGLLCRECASDYYGEKARECNSDDRWYD
jgi:hypothetical protein